MRSFVIALVLLGVAATAGAAGFENPSVVGQVPDRVLITVKSGVTLTPVKSDGVVQVGVPALDALAARFGVREMKPLYAGLTGNLQRDEHVEKIERVWAVDFAADKAAMTSVVAAYAAASVVEEARAVDICKMYDAYLPDDPDFLDGTQWFLRNLGFNSKSIRPIGAWAEVLGDSSVIVAITDSGVHWNHPDLGGTHPDRVTGAIWTNWTEYYGTAGVDDDLNGKIDDIRGWDFVDLGDPIFGWDEEDVVDEDNDPSDFEGHGTAVAGCVAALTNNGLGVAGTAPGVKLMALRVGWLPRDETQGLVRMDFAASAMVYAVNNGAKIINASWGSSSALANAVNVVQNQGGLIVTAAGNDNDQVPSYLGQRSGVIAVAATQTDDGKASFSSFGPWVELSAPGVGIHTTDYNWVNGLGGYSSTDGTSFSSPITAGAAALVWSAYPGITYRDVADTLMAYADNIDDVNPGFEGLLGAGRVNLLRIFGDRFHRVPADYVSLFDALQEASTGDTIALRGGDNYDKLRIHAKELQVLGGFDAAFATRDPLGNPTILHGDPIGSALEFQSNATSATLVDGFRCEEGGGKLLAGIPQSGRYGGVVLVFNASPTLRNLAISGGSVGQSNEFGGGGGLALVNSGSLVENAVITENAAIYGAGVYVYGGAPTLSGCTVANNDPKDTNFTYPPQGGGIYAVNTDLTLLDVVVEGHTELIQGGGIYVGPGGGAASLTFTGGRVAGNTARDNGAGVYVLTSPLVMSDVELQGNTKLATSTFMQGGGLFATGSTVELNGLTVLDNDATVGGGLSLNTCTSAVVRTSVFAGNSCAIFGGGVAVQAASAGEVSNNTVAGNDSPASGGAGFYLSGTLDFFNNISAFNTGGAGIANGVQATGAGITVSCNDVFGNDGTDWGGIADPTGTAGNISADPLFCNLETGNFHVATESPCAPEQSGGCELIGALSAGCGQDAVPGEAVVPAAFRVDHNFPNPFNPQTAIRFALPRAGFTTVAIFDVAGHRVRTLLAQELAAAEHEVRWTGRDDAGRAVSAGVYFYRVASGDNVHVGRMALVK